ncbi:MAG: PDZ domain-containing protein [Acidobacteriia bacterium]|nr:PDZ domain-containing protein [Terriglobia bacterium]
MNYRTMWTAGGLAALGLMLAALPGPSRAKQAPEERALAQMQQRLAEEAMARTANSLPDGDEVAAMASPGEGAGWLGVEMREITAEKAKELKLPVERGVLLSHVVADSPAAKAGLKENDVVTEINGQPIEGALQFRRMIREIPAGRSAQLTVWREGRAQSLKVTLGSAMEAHKAWAKRQPPREFTFHMPPMPEMPDMPQFEWHGEMMPGGRPRLGIDGEDLSGQLGAYFGAPDGEGILVRDVHEGSPAEKAGIKAGDVLIKFDSERLRTIGDLREKLAGVREQKKVKLGVLRNRSEITVEATIEPPEAPKPRKTWHPTNI